MNSLIDSNSIARDPAALRKRMDEDGYIFVRDLAPARQVLDVRAQIAAALDAVGWLASREDLTRLTPSDRARREQAEADPGFFVGYEAIQRVQAFHELAHASEIVSLMSSIVDDGVLVHPRKIARVGLPRDYEFMTPPHQDFRLIQGTADVFTLWMPLGDCPDALGGLAVLRGSQRLGLLPVFPVAGVGGLRVDIELDEDNPDWLGCDMAAGDVLVFHSLTVHAAKPNHTDYLRVSADFRYQSVREPVVLGSLGPHYAPPLPAYDDITVGWSNRASVDVPEGLLVVDMFDPMDPAAPTPPSRLLTLPVG